MGLLAQEAVQGIHRPHTQDQTELDQTEIYEAEAAILSPKPINLPEQVQTRLLQNPEDNVQGLLLGLLQLGCGVY